ncbi:ABC transporter F family member 4 [Forsythia ovata]|uniref:ABC transporter F family member 4 n=1 Tax=Forsythia ovata TaxID=205694 RepID=A0ABD1RNX7_9LAMI
MATRGRESALGKEKRGTSSCHLHANTTQQSRRLSLSRPRDPDEKHDPPASEKQIPNYLKPTFSSSPDVSKQPVKKQVSSDTSRKTNITRTRSLDKVPSSPSRTLNTHTSPNPTLRSSSFSAKTAIPQKYVPDKLLKSPEDGGKHPPLYVRSVSTVKKSSIVSKKQDTGIGASTKKEQAIGPPERVITPDIFEVRELETLQEFSVTEAQEETINAGSNNEMGDEVLVLEDMEPVRQVQLESRKDDEPVEYSKVSVHPDASAYFEMEEPDKLSLTKGTSSNQQDLDKHNADEENETKTNGSVIGSPKVEAEEKEGEGAKPSDKKEEVIIVVETFDPEGTKDQEVAKELKQEAENATPQPQSAQGMKNSVVSNDVIEETASKLRAQRRNKVRALAGAFETVISLQEPK